MARAINYLGHHTEGPIKVSVPLEGDVIHDHVGGLGEQRVPGLGRQQPEGNSGVGGPAPYLPGPVNGPRLGVDDLPAHGGLEVGQPDRAVPVAGFSNYM